MLLPLLSSFPQTKVWKDLWVCTTFDMLFGCNLLETYFERTAPSLAIPCGVLKLTNQSKASVLVCVEVMSWLTRCQATFSPEILDLNLLLGYLASN